MMRERRRRRVLTDPRVKPNENVYRYLLLVLDKVTLLVKTFLAPIIFGISLRRLEVLSSDRRSRGKPTYRRERRGCRSDSETVSHCQNHHAPGTIIFNRVIARRREFVLPLN